MKRYSKVNVIKLAGGSLETDKERAIAACNKGNDLCESKNYDEALDSYNEAIKLSPRYSDAYVNKALLLKDLGQLEESVNFYNKAIELSPNDAEMYRYKSISLFLLKRYEETLSCYDKAIELNPNYAIAYYGKGNSLDELRRYEEAIVCYDKAIELEPEFSDTYCNKGDSLSSLARYEEAIICYDEAIELDPKYYQAYNSKGTTLRSLKRYEEAIICYDKALELHPDDLLYLCNKGMALKTMKEPFKALECFNKAWEIINREGEQDPGDLSDANVHYITHVLGCDRTELMYKISQFEQTSITTKEKLHNLDPNNEEVQKVKEELDAIEEQGKHLLNSVLDGISDQTTSNVDNPEMLATLLEQLCGALEQNRNELRKLRPATQETQTQLGKQQNQTITSIKKEKEANKTELLASNPIIDSTAEAHKSLFEDRRNKLAQVTKTEKSFKIGPLEFPLTLNGQISNIDFPNELPDGQPLTFKGSMSFVDADGKAMPKDNRVYLGIAYEKGKISHIHTPGGLKEEKETGRAYIEIDNNRYYAKASYAKIQELENAVNTRQTEIKTSEEQDDNITALDSKEGNSGPEENPTKSTENAKQNDNNTNGATLNLAIETQQDIQNKDINPLLVIIAYQLSRIEKLEQKCDMLAIQQANYSAHIENLYSKMDNFSIQLGIQRSTVNNLMLEMEGFGVTKDAVAELMPFLGSLKTMIHQHESYLNHNAILDSIRSNPYKSSFDDVFRKSLTSTYLAASSVQTDIINTDKKGLVGKFGILLKSASNYVPILGSGVHLLGSILGKLDQFHQEKLLKNYASFVSSPSEMEHISSNLSIILVDDRLSKEGIDKHDNNITTLIENIIHPTPARNSREAKLITNQSSPTYSTTYTDPSLGESHAKILSSYVIGEIFNGHITNNNHVPLHCVISITENVCSEFDMVDSSNLLDMSNVIEGCVLFNSLGLMGEAHS